LADRVNRALVSPAKKAAPVELCIHLCGGGSSGSDKIKENRKFLPANIKAIQPVSEAA
jgi:hypothetical protein